MDSKAVVRMLVAEERRGEGAEAWVWEEASSTHVLAGPYEDRVSGFGVVDAERIPRRRWMSVVVTRRFPHAREMLGVRACRSTGAKEPLWAWWRVRAVRKAECRSRRSRRKGGRRRVWVVGVGVGERVG